MSGRCGLKAMAFVLAVTLAAPALNAAVPAAGPTLQDALQNLRRQGLDLVFSNALVRPGLRVPADLNTSGSLEAQAAALLEPFGLALRRADGGPLYVVRAERVVAPAPPVPPAVTRGAARPIEEMVVVSPRYRLVRDRHTRQQLDQRALEVMPSLGRDVLRAVNQLPGQASVGVSARSHMRGGNTDEVLYMVDGVQVIEPFHLDDFHALFSAINPALIESVDVYHAGFPAEYGSRISGVVDMNLAEAERRWQGGLSVDFVSAAAHAGGYAGDMQWLVSARRSTLDKILGSVEADYGRPKFHDELVRLAWEDGDSSLVLGWLYGNDELTLEDEGAGERARADYHNSTVWLRGDRSLGDTLDVDATASMIRVDNDREGVLDEPVDAVGLLDERREFSVYRLQSALHWQAAPTWALDTGLEAQWQEGDFRVLMNSRYGELGIPLQPGPSLEREVTTQRDGGLLTAFVSARQQLGDHARVEYGLRYDLQDNDPVHDRQISPRLQLSLELGAWHTFVDVGRYTQHQNLYELQLDDGLLELQAPQLADQLSAGTDWALTDALHARLEGYWRTVRHPRSRFENLYNRWVLLPELHADRVQIDPERAHTYGGELALDYQPNERLRWSLSVGLARAEERIGGEWRRRPWEQRRTVRGGLDWRPGYWQLGVIASYHSGWPTTSRQTEPLESPQQLYDRRLPDYFSLDLHAARRFEFDGSALEIYLDLSNATGADNVGGYRYKPDGPTLERHARRLLPAVPVLGVDWTW